MELDPTADKESLVEQIKKLQRSSPDTKQAWWEYCDTQLGGIKDPNRHEAPVLSEFVQAHQDGASWSTGGGSGRAPSQQSRRAPPSGRGYGTYAPAWGSDSWGCGWGGGGYGGGGRYGGGSTLDRNAPLRAHTHARDNGYTYDRVTGDRIKDVKQRR